MSPTEWTAVPMQGSGTFSVEAVIQTAVPRNTDKKGIRRSFQSKVEKYSETSKSQSAPVGPIYF